MKDPHMLPQDHHAIRVMLAKAEAEIQAEARAHPCRQCQLHAALNLEYGERLGIEGRRNESLRKCLIAAAAYGAAVTLCLVCVWWAR